MNAVEFFVLGGFIFLAPHFPKLVGNFLGLALIGIATLAHYWGLK